MSYAIRILCRSDARLTVGFIADFVRDGVYFEVFPVIEAEPSADTVSEFERIEIQYDKQKRPIVVTSTVGEEALQEIKDINDMAGRSGVSKLLLQRIAATHQVVAIEVDREKLTDDAWAFCDCIESSIARKLDGVIFVPDDGIYDPQLTGDVTTFTYDNGNRLLTGVDVSGTTTYTYDNNGNQLTIEEPSGDITTNTWDGENRLIQVEHPSGDVTTYAYNGDGLRVLQDDGVAETRFVYDGNNVVLELDDVGVVKADVTYLPAEYAQAISQHRDLESSFYLCDGIHNVRQLTDDAQVVTDEYSFDGWGKLTSSTGSTANSQLYKGEYLAYRKDPDAGPELQYSTHHRNYNPKTRRVYFGRSREGGFQPLPVCEEQSGEQDAIRAGCRKDLPGRRIVTRFSPNAGRCWLSCSTG
jgi:YD repeat-containing protein